MPDPKSTAPIAFNGINGSTGGYLTPATTPQELAAKIIGLSKSPLSASEESHQRDLETRKKLGKKHLGLKAGKDPKALAQAGWGVIFAFQDDKHVPALKSALRELLDWRQAKAAAVNAKYYREFVREDAYRPNEAKEDFLARFGMGPGAADPDKMPYYLLIVGDPETIPYDFQYQLDVQYAVGRLYFDHELKNGKLTDATLEQYAQYAHSVVEVEKAFEAGAWKLPRRVAFFGVRNLDDQATISSCDGLVTPLAAKFAQEEKGWQVDTILGSDAKRSRLEKLLGGAETPSFLFTASHGMGFRNDDPRQPRHQGALLCDEWPGPNNWVDAAGNSKRIPESFYVSADHVTNDARLLGLLAFFFACYGAGTPRQNDFPYLEPFTQEFLSPDAVPPHALVARLPQRLLGHPKGSALAVVGHVERAWEYSFSWEGAGPQLGPLDDVIKQLTLGFPIGAAMEYANTRYAELSAMLTQELTNVKFGKKPDDLKLANWWTANNDARSYVILGDPAVKLPVGDDGAATERPTAERTGPIVVLPPADNEADPQVELGAAVAAAAGAATAMRCQRARLLHRGRHAAPCAGRS